MAARMAGRELTSHDIVDHINSIRTDNRRENLRIVGHKGNSQNRKHIRSKSGFRGVSFHKQARKWQALVGHNGKSYYCGLFDTPEEASSAAEEKRRSLCFLGEAT